MPYRIYKERNHKDSEETRKMSNLTKSEAIEAMAKGHKIRHRHFSKDEWMTMVGSLIRFEDCNYCTVDEFWICRQDDSWSTGWSVIEAKTPWEP